MSDNNSPASPGNDETPEETLRRLQNESQSNSDYASGWTPPPVNLPPEDTAPPASGWGSASSENPYTSDPYGPPPSDPYGAPPPPSYGQGYGQNYGQFQSAPQPRNVDHPQTTTVLIMGIIALLCCQLISPVAWYMGHQARVESRDSHGLYSTNNTPLNIGWILGIVGTVILCLSILSFAFGFTDAALGM